ncbi:hypothetical protein AB1N83_008106 [Pleurotus pulmonarius]
MSDATCSGSGERGCQRAMSAQEPLFRMLSRWAGLENGCIADLGISSRRLIKIYRASRPNSTKPMAIVTVRIN